MKPITPLLNTFIKLADRIIDLEQTKLQDKQQIFNEIARPLFEGLEPAALNYIKLFQGSQEVLDDPQGILLGIASTLRKDRAAMIVTRIKVGEMTKQIIKNIQDESLSDFVLSIDHFFSSALNRVGEAATKDRNVIELIEESAFGEEGRIQVIADLNKILMGIEKEWASIVRSYEKVKINCAPSLLTTSGTMSPKYDN